MKKNTRSAWWVGLALLTVAGVAQAGEYRYAASHITGKSKDHVLSVITAYSQTCDEGCKYYGPHVKEYVKIDYKKTESSWFTWTHQSTAMKTVKYFSQVTVKTKSDGSIVLVTRLLDESDAALVKELEQKTGKEHKPAFDTGKTIFSITDTKDGKVKVVQDMVMTCSGLIDMFSSQIKAGQKEGAAITFKNIEKS